MDIQPSDVWDILSDYGKVLEAYGGYTQGVSERLLPHPREHIQQAFRLALATEQDEQVINYLEVGYLCLASFLPEPDGSIAMTITPILIPMMTHIATAEPTADLSTVRELVTDPEYNTVLEQSRRLLELIQEREEPIKAEIETLRKIRVDLRDRR